MTDSKFDEQADTRNGYDRPSNGYGCVQQEEIEMPNIDEGQELQHPSLSGNARGQEEEPDWCKYKKEKIVIAVLVIIIIIIICSWVVSSIIKTGTSVPLSSQKDAIKPLPFSCPYYWFGYYGHCYQLSEDEKNWKESQNSCTLHDASLAKITEKNMVLMRMFTRDHGLWIGLTRERDQPWKWLDGENATMEVNGNGGDCVFLDMDVTAISLSCSTEHYYVCEKIMFLRDPERELELIEDS